MCRFQTSGVRKPRRIFPLFLTLKGSTAPAASTHFVKSSGRGFRVRSNAKSSILSPSSSSSPVAIPTRPGSATFSVGSSMPLGRVTAFTNTFKEASVAALAQLGWLAWRTVCVVHVVVCMYVSQREARTQTCMNVQALRNTYLYPWCSQSSDVCCCRC